MNKTVVLECRSLYKRFTVGNETIEVIADVTMKIHAGESLAIIGSSGAGKTTLLTLLGGLDKPDSGQVLIMGKDINETNEKKRTKLRNQQLGFVYQFHHLLQEFSALENVQIPPMMDGYSAADSAEKASAMLAKVGLEHRLNHKPAELSGGERQRVAIARALVNHPACVLLDEPTGNLDQHNSELVYDLLQELNTELAVSFILVTHDQNLAKKMQAIARIDQGKIAVTKS